MTRFSRPFFLHGSCAGGKKTRKTDINFVAKCQERCKNEIQVRVRYRNCTFEWHKRAGQWRRKLESASGITPLTSHKSQQSTGTEKCSERSGSRRDGFWRVPTKDMCIHCERRRRERRKFEELLGWHSIRSTQYTGTAKTRHRHQPAAICTFITSAERIPAPIKWSARVHVRRTLGDHT